MIVIGDRIVELSRLELRTPESTTSITRKEADLLEYLAERPGEVVSQEELLRQVWNYAPSVRSRAAYHAVARLRQRLEPDPSHPIYLVTVRGAGFRLDGCRIGAPEVPARPPAATPSPLPRRRSRFFGREHEIGWASERLREARAPLVTLLGLGGIGKTTLATEIVSRLSPDYDCVLFCDLTGIVTERGILGALARASGLRDRGSIQVATVAAHLRALGTVLGLLDNVEPTAEAVALVVSGLLDACPDVQVLATSRDALSLRGEARFLVEGLPVPDPGDASGGSPSVDLFEDRVRLGDPDFALDQHNAAAVGEVVGWLDGWPLAIELAAAQVAVRGLDAVRSATVEDLALSLRDVQPRHQTLARTLAWSWSLLEPDEKAALGQLSWFVAGFATVTVDAVLGDGGRELLGRLERRGWVRKAEGHEDRHRLLAPVREWVAAQIEDPAPARARFVQWAVDLATDLVSVPEKGRTRSMRDLAAEAANLDTAWVIADAKGSGDVVQLALGLGILAWHFGGHDQALQRLRTTLLDFPDEPRMWHRAGMLAACSESLERACSDFEHAIRHGKAQGVPHDRLATYLNHLATFSSRLGRTALADQLFADALEIVGLGGRFEMAILANWCVSLARARDPRAIEVGRRALAMCQSLGDPVLEPHVLHNLARAELAADQQAEAVAHLTEAIELVRGQKESAFVARFLVTLGEARERDAPELAEAHWREAIELALRLAEFAVLAEASARLARRRGETHEVRQLLEQAEAYEALCAVEVRSVLDDVRAQLTRDDAPTVPTREPPRARQRSS